MNITECVNLIEKCKKKMSALPATFGTPKAGTKGCDHHACCCECLSKALATVEAIVDHMCACDIE